MIAAIKSTIALVKAARSPLRSSWSEYERKIFAVLIRYNARRYFQSLVELVLLPIRIPLWIGALIHQLLTDALERLYWWSDPSNEVRQLNYDYAPPDPDIGPPGTV